MKLTALRFFVRDLGSAKTFYTDVLGLRLTHDGTDRGYLSFESAGIHIIVEAIPADAPPRHQVLVGGFVGASFEVKDIDAEYDRMTALGVEFTGAPEKQFWGGTLATFNDPAGNELQLAQYPS